MSHRNVPRRQLQRTIEELFATAKVTGCSSLAFKLPPRGFTPEILRWLILWADGQRVAFLHDSVEGRLYRFPFYPGQGEWIHRDIRDEVEAVPSDVPSAVVLYNVPQPGPQGGQIHFGVVAWESDDGPEEVEVMVYRRPRL